MSDDLKFVTLHSGLRMGYVEFGPANGEPVILLHGFPEFHWSYRFQWSALAEAGFRQRRIRAYNQTDKTPPYDIDTLTQDVAQLQDALGITRSHIDGHDWGGVVSYAFAARFPQRVNHLAILNVSHPNAYLDAVPVMIGWYRVLAKRIAQHKGRTNDTLSRYALNLKTCICRRRRTGCRWTSLKPSTGCCWNFCRCSNLKGLQLQVHSLITPGRVAG